MLNIESAGRTVLHELAGGSVPTAMKLMTETRMGLRAAGKLDAYNNRFTLASLEYWFRTQAN